MTFRNILLSAILVGVVTGITYGLFQHFSISPIIYAAEAYEVAEETTEPVANPGTAQHHNTPAHSHGEHHHNEDAWSPEDGIERINFYPNSKKDQINQEMIYMSQNITSIVYGIHFANTQQLFDAKCHQFFETLFKYEKILTNTEIGFFKMKVPQAFLISYYLRLWYVLMLRTDQGFE